MEWVETTGRTVDEAKDAALDQLGVDEQDAEFEIVEEPRFGLFGRLRSEARVRARVRPTKPRPKEERRDRRGRQRPAGTEAASKSENEDESSATPAPRGPGRRSSGAERDRTPGASPSRAPSDVVASDTSDEGSGEGVSSGGSRSGTRGNRRRGPVGTAGSGDTVGDGSTADEAGMPGGSPRNGSPRPIRTRSGRSPDDSSYDDQLTSSGGGMEVSLDEQGEVAREFLVGLVERMNLEAEVAIAQPEEETIELNLRGPDLGLLIGPKGATLLAIQDLTRTVVQRKTSAANGRILVDVSGYRRKRKDALARFSRQVAEEVQATGTRRVLEPMSAADRKIVHDTVNDIEGVLTVSEGEDPRRRVVILPVPAET